MRSSLLLGVGLFVLACGSTTSGAGSGQSRDGGTGSSAATGGSSATGGAGNGGAGTGGGAVCSPGTETCPCYGNGTCNAGLTCASNLCVNLGGTGGAGGAGGAVGTGGAGGSVQCAPQGAGCNSVPNGCCSGLACIVDPQSSLNGKCAKLCTSGSECPGGCCGALSNGFSFACMPPQDCTSCRQAGAPCLDNVNACCSNTLCGFANSTTTTATCLPLCMSNFDCASGCCAPFGINTSVCSDPVECGVSCLPSGTRPCGLGTPCCPGSYCISDNINQICLPLCASNAECASGCCAAPNGNGVYVCTDRGFCP